MGIKKGDVVVMNDKYYVSNKNKGKKFVVRSNPCEVCGVPCVWLRGFSGAYALDGLTKVGEISE